MSELFIVERVDNGEWIDRSGDGGYSVFTDKSEAQDALESEACSCEEGDDAFRIVKYVRVDGLQDDPHEPVRKAGVMSNWEEIEKQLEDYGEAAGRHDRPEMEGCLANIKGIVDAMESQIPKVCDHGVSMTEECQLCRNPIADEIQRELRPALDDSTGGGN